MSEDQKTKEKIASASQLFRILAVLGWTGLCGIIWIVWAGSVVGGAVENPSGEATVDAIAITGGAACVTGCTGGVWFAGLVIFALFYVIIRR